MPEKLTRDQLAPLIMDALALAVSGDSDGAATALQTMGEGTDNNGMYGVCCGIAQAGKNALQKLQDKPQPGDAMWVLQELQPGGLAADAPTTFAVRFLVAYANGDQPMCIALFDTALRAGGEQYVDSVCALLANVAGLARLAIEQLDQPSR